MKTPRPSPIKAEGGAGILSDFAHSRHAEGRIWAEGYTRNELESAQERC